MSIIYREENDSIFTHAGKKYSINKIIEQVENKPIIEIPVHKLKWLLEYAFPDLEREKRADLTAPILVHKLKDQLVVIDGLHRLAKAVKLNKETLPARLVTDNELLKAEIMNKLSTTLKKISEDISLKFAAKKISWPFNARPYSDQEAQKLLKPVLSKETINWHYHKHHKGYVDALNKIETELQTAVLNQANGNYSPIGELKRRQTWNHSGAVLHDIYWQNLGGDGNPKKGKEILQAIIKQWGSFNIWKKEFIAIALSTKLSGWALLVYDQLYSKKLLNILVDEHQNGAIWGGIPLVACDVFEHSYYLKDGPNRTNYINNFLNNLHWERINQFFLENTK